MDPNTKTTPNEEDGGKAPEYTPPATQAELDRIVEARLAKERKKHPAVDEVTQLREKAAAWDKAQEEGKSELEKAQARAEAAEKEAAALKTQKQIASWAEEVAKASGVPANALRGNTKEEIEAHAESLKPLLGKDKDPVVDGDGKQPPASAGGGDWLREEFQNK
jgi:hypothetical protein